MPTCSLLSAKTKVGFYHDQLVRFTTKYKCNYSNVTLQYQWDRNQTPLTVLTFYFCLPRVRQATHFQEAASFPYIKTQLLNLSVLGIMSWKETPVFLLKDTLFYATKH